MGWREDALSEIENLKPYWVSKYAWSPDVINYNDEDVLDLLVTLHSQRVAGRRFVLRLRYQPDWQTAGRRESFVNPDDPSVEGVEYWPSGINAVKPTHNPPCICLRGVWGYHSLLHKERLMGDSTLLSLLLELQTLLDQK